MEQPRRKTGRQRTSAACDACRARKVKCLREEGSSCIACIELKISCTLDRPRQRRGPKNKYLLAHAVRVLQQQDPSSTEHSTQSGLISCERVPSLSEGRSQGLEALGPFSVLEHIMHDWFDLVHPVCPIFHRSLFLQRLENGDARHDLSFRILVISLCAATVGTLQRKRSHYHPVSVERCVKLAEENGFWKLGQQITIERCQAVYNFASALSTEYGMDNPDSFRMMSEAFSSVQFLLFYELFTLSFMDQQLLKRLYWLLFAGMCTMDMLGRPHLGILRAQDVHNLVPLELTDDELYPLPPSTKGYTSSGSNLSYVPGLNHLSKLFTIWFSSQQDPPKSITSLQEHIIQAQRVILELPPDLTWHALPKPNPDPSLPNTKEYINELSPRSSTSVSSYAHSHFDLSIPYSPHVHPSKSITSTLGINSSKDFGYDVQTVNIYITQLHIRSNLLERMSGLAQSQGLRFTPREIINERQNVVSEMLEILYHMPQEVFDANGYSILPKIRDIGSVLLDRLQTADQTVLGSGNSGDNLQASIKLDMLLKKLENLDVKIFHQCGSNNQSDPHLSVSPQ